MNNLDIIELLSGQSAFNTPKVKELMQMLEKKNMNFTVSKSHHILRESIAQSNRFPDAQQELSI